ncbi:UDP-glycosyltransferase UGT33J1 [Danaus plexippus plexippus]|uniref:UDP-glucuronosyltransferase n=1 Tax=Danaus plexippus plexippus TaxID=278856 RepID=A0A212EXZ2_DANPL|nr:UDP-glycosyltransferase UGT33J1 [Danaus plexippus plexippus]
MEREAKENILLEKLFGSDIPPLHELANNVNLLFLNVHPIWIDNQPVPPNVVFIGGIHKQPPEEIPTDLLYFLNASTNGFVYISFGTNVKPSLLPPEKIDIMIKVLSKLPYSVLWKWDKEGMPRQTNNIKYVPWVPQKDILMHPNIKLFVTQCGLQSTEEAINALVPLIGIPVLGDQFYNAEKYVYHGIGIKLDLDYLSEEVFSGALETILNSKSYRENLIRLRKIMNDQPESALQRAIWWIDYTLRHGGAKHLRARGANITWAQYLELELVFTVLSAVLITYLILGGFA